jgi:hypothetical protein
MSDFKIGDRVRIVKGKSFPSRIHEGEEGQVVERSPLLAKSESPEHYDALPVSVLFDRAFVPHVWSAEELEHIE